ncbi:GNAT family N-acetyltransferase [Cohnella silvisoli]|uniref:GNAT family protein n=1 Tax=Cohnella silvisoli TaxID=2873699 RepID=A0ABV1KYB3_9BACL|nr:GNAT family protein [Cohnella silvisoli]MCD9021843.1 GNAT family N-acetyltransferase [Cohnella silvisoli]
MITLRTVTKDDVVAYWELRLEGLLRNPESFASSYEESVNQSMQSVMERMSETDDHYIVGAFNDNDDLVGMSGFIREKRLKLKHKGLIWGVYVTTDYRQQGIGKKMIEEIVTRAKSIKGLTQINLSTMATNEAGIRLYQSLGFETYGVERKALKVGDVYLDEHLMALHLE